MEACLAEPAGEAENSIALQAISMKLSWGLLYPLAGTAGVPGSGMADVPGYVGRDRGYVGSLVTLSPAGALYTVLLTGPYISGTDIANRRPVSSAPGELIIIRPTHGSSCKKRIESFSTVPSCATARHLILHRAFEFLKDLVPWYLKVRLCTSLESHCELRRGMRFFVALPVSKSIYLEHVATVANCMCIFSSTNAAMQINASDLVVSAHVFRFFPRTRCSDTDGGLRH